MSGAALVAAAGWALSLAALGGALRVRRGYCRRLRLVDEAAHELRGPLCAARLGLHALESAGGPAARRAAAVDLELRRAGLALEDLAAAPRGRRTEERRELLDARALVAGASLGWAATTRAHGATLRVERSGAPALLRGDRIRLSQALANLVINAAEHGGGDVRVTVTALRGRVRIEVADDGPGLPASVEQLAAAGRSARGPRGHGLAVAARVAERHGGRLATAPSARGARLVLDLPGAPVAPRSASSVPRSASPVARGRAPAPRGASPAPRSEVPASRGASPVPRSASPAPRGASPAPLGASSALRGASVAARRPAPLR